VGYAKPSSVIMVCLNPDACSAELVNLVPLQKEGSANNPSLHVAGINCQSFDSSSQLVPSNNNSAERTDHVILRLSVVDVKDF
jgi:hypothetical protein